MRHWHFLKSTCDIRTPRQGPQLWHDNCNVKPCCGPQMLLHEYKTMCFPLGLEVSDMLILHDRKPCRGQRKLLCLRLLIREPKTQNIFPALCSGKKMNVDHDEKVCR